MPLLRAAGTWVVTKMFGNIGALVFPEGYDDYTDAEKRAWYLQYSSGRTGSNNPDNISPTVGNVGDGRTGTTSQVSSGLGSLFVGQDGKAVYTDDGRLVGNQGTGGPLFDLDSDGDGVPDGYFYNSYSENQPNNALSWQPATDGSGQGVFNYTDPETGAGTLLNPGQKIPGTGYGADARFAPVGPDGEDYGFYDSEGRALYDEFGRTIDPETGKLSSAKIPEYADSGSRNMDTSNLDPLRQYSATRPDNPRNINPTSQYGLRFQDPNAKDPNAKESVVIQPEPYVPPVYEPVFPEYATNPGGTPISPVAPQANPFMTQPVNAIAPPPVSPFAIPVAPPVQASPFQGGIGSFVQQPVSNNLFGGG